MNKGGKTMTSTSTYVCILIFTAAGRVSNFTHYSNAQRLAAVKIFSSLDCKVTALVVLKSIEGFECLSEMRIKQWMTVGTEVNRGRPRSEEFEEEVMYECERANDPKRKRPSSANDYSYELVRNSANALLDKEYCDEKTGCYVKKWRFNKTTRNLRFTNKWIFGVLRRHSMRCTLASHVNRLTGGPKLKDDISSPLIDDFLLVDGISSAFDEEDGECNHNVYGNLDLINDMSSDFP